MRPRSHHGVARCLRRLCGGRSRSSAVRCSCSTATGTCTKPCIASKTGAWTRQQPACLGRRSHTPRRTSPICRLRRARYMAGCRCRLSCATASQGGVVVLRASRASFSLQRLWGLVTRTVTSGLETAENVRASADRADHGDRGAMVHGEQVLAQTHSPGACPAAAFLAAGLRVHDCAGQAKDAVHDQDAKRAQGVGRKRQRPATRDVHGGGCWSRSAATPRLCVACSHPAIPRVQENIQKRADLSLNPSIVATTLRVRRMRCSKRAGKSAAN